MSNARGRLQELVNQAGALFECEEFKDPEMDFEVQRAEDEDPQFYYADVVREETDEAYRFCLLGAEPLEQILPRQFEQFQMLEDAIEDEYSGAVLVWRTEGDDENFWYIYRVETGEIGLFHSTLSTQDVEVMDDDEDEDEDEEEWEGEDEDGEDEKK